MLTMVATPAALLLLPVVVIAPVVPLVATLVGVVVVAVLVGVVEDRLLVAGEVKGQQEQEAWPLHLVSTFWKAGFGRWFRIQFMHLNPFKLHRFKEIIPI